VEQLTDEEAEPLLPVDPAYTTVLRARLITGWTLCWIAAATLDRSLLTGLEGQGLPTVLVAVLGISAASLAPQRIYGRLRYRLADRFLQVLRGWLVHTDTIVPLIRVQHIDVTRGPFDKMFGTARLVVHTAGTHNSVVSLPGLAPDRAAEIRDAIREHVRTDYA
jgi:hypothetical protein